MSYLSFDDYVSMGGELSQKEFEKCCFTAETVIDRYTSGRIKFDTEENRAKYKDVLERVCFELIETISSRGGVLIASESNNGMSRTYQNQSNAEYNNIQFEIVYQSLKYYKDTNGTPLCFIGVEHV